MRMLSETTIKRLEIFLNHFGIQKSQVCLIKGSALEALFSGRHELEMKDERVFIDRDPQAFKMVVEFIRNYGNFSEAHQINKAAFKQELEYWSIQPDYFKIERKTCLELAKNHINKFHESMLDYSEQMESEYLKSNI